MDRYCHWREKCPTFRKKHKVQKEDLVLLILLFQNSVLKTKAPKETCWFRRTLGAIDVHYLCEFEHFRFTFFN